MEKRFRKKNIFSHKKTIQIFFGVGTGNQFSLFAFFVRFHFRFSKVFRICHSSENFFRADTDFETNTETETEFEPKMTSPDDGSLAQFWFKRKLL